MASSTFTDWAAEHEYARKLREMLAQAPETFARKRKKQLELPF
jgi:hypothetical protein